MLNNRDTQEWAMKCSAMQKDGQWFNVQKDPVTSAAKKSKAGRVTLYTNEAGEYVSGVEGVQPNSWSDKPWVEALREVYRDGKLLIDVKFDEVRANSNK